MSANPTILCTIAARGGSKGVPDKNIRDVGGKPLIAHTIEQAKAWDRSSDIIVSTDDEKVANIAKEYDAEVPFMRPQHLATDSAGKLPVIKHAHQELEGLKGITYDYIVDLDATAPIRCVKDIEKCFQTVHGTSAKNAYTVTEADKNPYFNMVELGQEGYASLSKDVSSKIVRRQDAPTVYEMNASVYVWENGHLQDTSSVHQDRTRVSVMPPKRSIDIDRPIDLAFVEFLLENEDEYL